VAGIAGKICTGMEEAVTSVPAFARRRPDHPVIVQPDRGGVAAKRLSKIDRPMLLQIVATRPIHHGLNADADADGQMYEGEDWKYRQCDDRLEQDFPAPIDAHELHRQEQPAEGAAAPD